MPFSRSLQPLQNQQVNEMFGVLLRLGQVMNRRLNIALSRAAGGRSASIPSMSRNHIEAALGLLRAYAAIQKAKREAAYYNSFRM